MGKKFEWQSAHNSGIAAFQGRIGADSIKSILMDTYYDQSHFFGKHSGRLFTEVFFPYERITTIHFQREGDKLVGVTIFTVDGRQVLIGKKGSTHDVYVSPSKNARFVGIHGTENDDQVLSLGFILADP